jgi:hypothetical protein
MLTLLQLCSGTSCYISIAISGLSFLSFAVTDIGLQCSGLTSRRSQVQYRSLLEGREEWDRVILRLGTILVSSQELEWKVDVPSSMHRCRNQTRAWGAALHGQPAIG